MRDKKALVTGADGFIGSHLVETLIKEGCRVRAFTYYNSFNSWGWLDTFPREILNEVEVFAGDVRDPNGVRTAVRDMDLVFHLAALIGIPYSYHSPDSYIDTNIRGTMNVLQACKDLGTERTIVTSTSEVYGTAQRVPINEKHPLQGQSPYSATKISADKISESFHRSFNLPVITARPFNTYGPRQSARAVIPTIITQLLSGCGEIRLGSLTPTRDLNYVQDICNGFIALARCEKAIGREINIGSGHEISVGDLANMIIGQINPNAKIIATDERKRPADSEVERLLCDNSLIKKLTGWTPSVSLEEGIKRTIQWFKETKNLDRYKWDIYNV
ncbi:MAG: SDR family NAD(P)-dependent oxidoreductase [Nitrospiraceae bacterium]|nr:MAG: SDR family NAD(P)-dependent oxidoreductase [Nitrospiraceae bacterium]